MAFLLLFLFVPSEIAGASSKQERILQVPRDFESIQGAVDSAKPGDVILIAEGTYKEQITVRTERITIRGENRSRVLIDGEFIRPIGIRIEKVHGVTVENLSVCCHTAMGVQWTEAHRWTGRYLTTYNNGSYGVFAISSSGPGVFDNVYASGHPDTGIYVGQCSDCYATISNSIAERNHAGYSGANTVGVTVKDSVFRFNSVGLIPNAIHQGAHNSRDVEIVGNTIHSNGNSNVPATEGFGLLRGAGIALVGVDGGSVRSNDIRANGLFGVAVATYREPPKQYRSGGVKVENNIVGEGHSLADLLLAANVDEGNCFQGNKPSGQKQIKEVPSGLQSSGSWSCSNPNTPAGTTEAEEIFWNNFVGGKREIDYRTMPKPRHQLGLGEESSPTPTLGGGALREEPMERWGGIWLAAAAAVVLTALVLLIRLIRR